MQPFKMMVGDMVNEEQKGTAYAIQSALCNAGSVVGYLFPIFFTWIGIANTAPEGVIPDSVKWSFYAGAAILILCSLYTFATVKELDPKEYEEFHGVKKNAGTSEKGFISLLRNAPSAFWTVGLVQFFCWAAFMYMWTYSNGAIAVNCFGWDGVNAADASFQDAGGWVGVVFCVQAVGSLLWAALLPKLEEWTGNKGAYAISLLVGAAGFISVFFVQGDYTIAGYLIPSKYILFVSYLLIGAAWAAMLALPFTIVTNAIKGGNMGYYLGLFNCTICIPQIVAALCGGLVLSLVGHHQSTMMIVSGVLLVIGAFCVTVIKGNK